MIFLAFVLPLASYLLVLAYLNRGRHPIMLAGAWDFVGVLLGASGFLLFGGPAILTGLYEHWRFAWLLGQTRPLRGVADQWEFWIAIWGAYFLAVILFSSWVLARRKRLTSIYNVDPVAFDEVLEAAIERSGLECHRGRPGRYMLRTRESLNNLYPFKGAAGSDQGTLAGPVTLLPVPALTRLDVVSFPVMHHVTLRWSLDDEPVRDTLEAELRTLLRQLETGTNPAGAWFMSAAISLYFASFGGLALVLLLRIFRVWR